MKTIQSKESSTIHCDKLDQIDRVIIEGKEIIRQITNLILECDDNPKINRIKGVNAFTMKKSDLSKGLIISPEYYDFKYQYMFIRNYLMRYGLGNFRPKLEAIFRDQFIKVGLNKQKINPEVINNIKAKLKWVEKSQ